MANTTPIRTQCPHCKQAYAVPASAQGRRGKCAGCGKSFYVHDIEAPPLDPMPLLPNREYARVACHVCGTQMYGRLSDVGRRLKCPDCNSLTPLPPPRAAAKVVPLDEIDAYELMDDQIEPSSTSAVSSEGFTFHCSLCDSMLAGSLESVGTYVDCPDCGRANHVPRPAERRQVVPTADDGYELDDLPVAAGDDVRAHAYSDFKSIDEAEQAKRISRVATDRKSRPKPPPLPTVQGVLKILWAPGLFTRWITVSAFLMVSSLIAAWAIGMTMQAGLGFAMAYALLGFCALLLAAISAAGALAALSATGIAIVTESSEGNDTVSVWPTTNPIDWMGEFFYVMIAITAGGLPGWLLSQVFEPEFVVPTIAASIWLFMPVVLLSQLEATSPLALLAPSVVARIGPTIHHWFLFYLVTGVQFALAAGLTVGLGLLHPIAAVVGVPAFVLVALLYFRCMGRLAWAIGQDR